MMKPEEASLKQLFQQEFSKMVAVISKLFGLQHIELAEDIVSETFLLASETWGVKGMPDNPSAWLYAVAKQKTLYHFRRKKIFDDKIAPELKAGQARSEEQGDPDFSRQNIKDSQLQMLFAICTPAIASEAQIGLALRILCGFGIDEIAEAFLSNKETINKRLFRAKEKLRTENIRMEFPSEPDIGKRLDTVLHIIYLLFNEGYYSKTQDQLLRHDLCLEALRLGLMLSTYERTDLPKTDALMALMCFHASRFDARQSSSEEPVLYEAQDESRWNQALIAEGHHFLERSARGSELSSYHLEARIAYWHCIKEDSTEKWTDILSLYDQLLRINYSPVVALNRVYALYKTQGAAVALREAETLSMDDDHFYHVLLAELCLQHDPSKAAQHLQKAWTLAKSPAEKQGIRLKLDALEKK